MTADFLRDNDDSLQKEALLSGEGRCLIVTTLKLPGWKFILLVTALFIMEKVYVTSKYANIILTFNGTP